MEDREQLSFWQKVQIQIKNSGSKTALEFGQNLLGIQTCFEKSEKFSKNLVFHDLPECEFRLTWLYGKIFSFHRNSI
jgi:hypothetical protein